MLHPEFKVIHINDSLSRLYFRINSSELLYTKKNADTTFKAVFTISFALYESFESGSVLDSASMVLKDSPLPEKPKDIISYIEFESSKRDGILQAKLSDINRNQYSKAYVKVNKTSPNSSQNFTLTLKGNKHPSFDNFINSKDKFVIEHRDKGYEILTVRYYNRFFDLADPPFSIGETRPLDYKADSIFKIKAGKEYSFPKTGMYHIQVDTLDKQGLTLFRYEDHFPLMSSTEQMLYPIRFLTSKQEYTKIKESENLKKAVDQFWLDVAGNPSRARELVRKYYNRVQDANRYFTSYLEGWKTDRGMIYLVYGPPNIIYKSTGSETWVYGEENNMMSLNFTFYRLANPFSEEDYELSRSPIYKSSWYRAVDTWRTGRVFTDN